MSRCEWRISGSLGEQRIDHFANTTATMELTREIKRQVRPLARNHPCRGEGGGVQGRSACLVSYQGVRLRARVEGSAMPGDEYGKIGRVSATSSWLVTLIAAFFIFCRHNFILYVLVW